MLICFGVSARRIGPGALGSALRCARMALFVLRVNLYLAFVRGSFADGIRVALWRGMLALVFGDEVRWRICVYF